MGLSDKPLYPEFYDILSLWCGFALSSKTYLSKGAVLLTVKAAARRMVDVCLQPHWKMNFSFQVNFFE